MECDYVDCENEAEYYDEMETPVCEECMTREVNDGDGEIKFEHFEKINHIPSKGGPATVHMMSTKSYSIVSNDKAVPVRSVDITVLFIGVTFILMALLFLILDFIGVF